MCVYCLFLFLDTSKIIKSISPIILDYLRLSQIISDYLRLSQIISDYLRLSQTISDWLPSSIRANTETRLDEESSV